jgi:uncharacterized protein (TIGR01615 family)
MFDLELSQKGFRSLELEPASSPKNRPNSESPVIQRLRYLARPVAQFEVDLLQDVQSLSSSLRESFSGSVPIAQLASDLAAMGYRCSIQCVESPGMSDAAANYGPDVVDKKCLELLRHEFLLCSGTLDGTSDHQCIIDPQFRDQFLLGKHNPEYDELLRAVPLEFVGSALRLQALAAVICAEMTKVYQELGIALPPWRRPHAVLGKWFDTTAMPGNQPLAQDIPAAREQQPTSESKSNFFSMLKMHKESMRKGKPRHSGPNEVFEKSNKPHRQGHGWMDDRKSTSSTVLDGHSSSNVSQSKSSGPVSLLAQGLQRQST